MSAYVGSSKNLKDLKTTPPRADCDRQGRRGVALRRGGGVGATALYRADFNITGGRDVIRKEAWPFYRTIFGVHLCKKLEESKGPTGEGAGLDPLLCIGRILTLQGGVM